MGTEIPMNRFRPNIVLEGLKPNEEDTQAEIQIGELKLYGVKPCARCVMTTIDQKTAEKGSEPLNHKLFTDTDSHSWVAASQM